MEEQFNDLMIDWSCVKTLKHLCKIIFSEGFRALWAKLDKSQKKYVLRLSDLPCWIVPTPTFFRKNLQTIM